MNLVKNISPAEAASMAIALSLDGLAVGFGAALGGVSWLAVILLSLVTGMFAIIAVSAKKPRINLNLICHGSVALF